jgi:hypothetical protein
MDKKRYDYLIGYTSDDELNDALNRIEETEDAWGDSDYSIIRTIYSSMESDTEDDSKYLLKMYLDADEKERAIMDAVLICVCGYSMSSIIKEML